MSVRLDKWLHVARMYKTRTKATHACDLGRVQVNGQSAKPHRHLNPGDKIELEQGEWQRILIVKELKDRPVAKAEAALLYEDQSPPRPAADPLARLLRRPPALREAGAGRPTKKDRREMDRFAHGDVGEPDSFEEDEDEDEDDLN
jgi:ribosome-associated heat shock protein Hsp15